MGRDADCIPSWWAYAAAVFLGLLVGVCIRGSRPDIREWFWWGPGGAALVGALFSATVLCTLLAVEAENDS